MLLFILSLFQVRSLFDSTYRSTQSGYIGSERFTKFEAFMKLWSNLILECRIGQMAVNWRGFSTTYVIRNMSKVNTAESMLDPQISTHERYMVKRNSALSTARKNKGYTI